MAKYRRLGPLTAMAAAILLFSPSFAEATDRDWNVAEGDWSIAENWMPINEPNGDDRAYIDNGGTASVTEPDEICGELYVGELGTGTINMTGGSLNVTDWAYVGNSGVGTFNQYGGTNNTDDLRIGHGSAGNGTYNLSGTGFLETDSVFVGYSGKGTFTHLAGTNEIYSYLYLGSNAGSVGTYDLSGTGDLSSYSETVGNSGIGNFYHSGGSNTANFLTLGANSGSIGYYVLSGSGQLTINNGSIGTSGIGFFIQPGGTHTITTGGLTLGKLTGSSGTYNLTGGTLILSSLSAGTGSAAFNFGGGTLQANDYFSTSLPMTLTGTGGNANIDSAGYAITLSGLLSGMGGLDKLGAGTLTLSNENTYSGDTTVDGGTLKIAGGIDAGGTSLIDVQSGTAVLKTVGVSKTDLNITTAPSTMFQVESGAHEIGTIAGSGNTQVDSGASLTVTSIFQGTLTVGSGAKVSIRPIVGGGSSGETTAPVPEPSTLVLLAGALALLACRWARKTRKGIRS